MLICFHKAFINCCLPCSRLTTIHCNSEEEPHLRAVHFEFIFNLKPVPKKNPFIWRKVGLWPWLRGPEYEGAASLGKLRAIEYHCLNCNDAFITWWCPKYLKTLEVSMYYFQDVYTVVILTILFFNWVQTETTNREATCMRPTVGLL